MPWTVYTRHGQRKYLTNKEIDAFVREAGTRSIDVRNFCRMIAYTGCRISEALSLTADSIDFEAKHVIIKCLKKRGKRVFRAIPLPQKFLKDLSALHRSRKDASGALWPWSRMTGYRRVCEVMESAGIRGDYASPKGLRHGFGVRAIQAGIPLTLVQRWLGHADIKTTAIYTSAVGPEEREIAARMWRQKTSPNPSDLTEIDYDKSEYQALDAAPAPCEEKENSGDIVTRAEFNSVIKASETSDFAELVNANTPSDKNAAQSLWKRMGYCSLRHFWLKCRSKVRCKSTTYYSPREEVPVAANQAIPAPIGHNERFAMALWPLGGGAIVYCSPGPEH